MIPSGMRRGAGARTGKGLPLPLMIAAGVGALIVLICAWTLLTMGREPATETVTADVPVQL